ncbi:hypothetical protein F0169_11570 [Pseudomonas sp. MAFF 212408]|uniref:Uncharacterized protein n=1 Tax=Pseudomonas kitaguniensis TaxID=2607908 RepID=A0A5N7KKH3_9PSED|nr:hypothetical protein [Pseudomonas kitaguniensis]
MNISMVRSPWAVMALQQAGPALEGKGEKPVDIVNGFNVRERRFGEDFDGSTHAAVIKMMMMTFGQSPADMFEHIQPSGDGYEITMKDEFKVHVSHQELQLAARASTFAGDDQGLVGSANVVLAAFVKRQQSVKGHADFDTALAESLRGETTLRCLKSMGVYGMSQSVPASELVGAGEFGVLETHNVGSALVLDGVSHSYGKQRRVDHGYGYKLFNDPAAACLRSPSRQTPPVRPMDIWSGFYQGLEGNCVTVSAIKAAMTKFGQNPEGVYKQVTATADGYHVMMRDGFSLHLTHAELRLAKGASHFYGSDQGLLDNANFLFAVSAKRAQTENNDFRGSESFEVAMETLNDGEYPGEALRRLGLHAYVRDSDVHELLNGAIGTVAGFGHSMAVIDGVLDYYGEKYDLAALEWTNSGYRVLKLV